MKNEREVSRIEPSAPARRKKRVAAYARVSAESERPANSLSVQMSYYSDYIQKNPEWVYAGIYADSGITGTLTARRGGFRRLMEDCENGGIDIILVKSISRFARNTVDLLSAARRLKELGIEVIFEKEQISSMSGEGELMLSVLASFAQEESRSVSENVKWSVRKRFEKGIPNGRAKVFGYDWKGDVLAVNEREAEIVKRIFCDFLNGKSPYRIGKELTAEGITTRAGYQWTDSKVRFVLKNVTYTGNMLLQKVFVADPITKNTKENRGELPRFFVKNTHEPIIEREVFERVRDELERRKKKRAE